MKTSDIKSGALKTLKTKAKMCAAKQHAIPLPQGPACPDVRRNKNRESHAAISGSRAEKSGAQQVNAMDRRQSLHRHDEEHHRQKYGARRKRGIHQTAQQPA